MKKLPEHILALASIVQTSALVNELAYKGQCDAKSCDTSIKSLEVSNNKASEIYPELDDLQVGIQALTNMLKKTGANKNILLYSLSLIKLEKALMREQKMLDTIATSISEIKNNAYIDINHETAIAKLATTYKNSAGKLQPTIMINGKVENLKNHNIANHIRALLLAGIRSVSLWRNTGGSLLQLIFNKRKIINQLEQLNA
jgi:high frequency lysogenization protein